MKIKAKTTKVMKRLPKDRVEDLVRELGKKHGIIAPVRVGERTLFKELRAGDEICLGSNTTNSPKEFFLPCTETLFSFKRNDNEEFELNEDIGSDTWILFGIRPCDVQALLLLDLVAGGEFEDPYYKKRRENTVLLAFSCSDAMEGCFCTSFGAGPSLKGDVDILFTDIGEHYLAEPFTGRGGDILNLKIFEKAIEGDERIRDERVEEVRGRIRKRDLTKLPEKLASSFDGEIWSDLSKGCVSCAACTYICPTCYCFDVVDEERSLTSEGRRIRCWDTCMFPSFTRLAGGENPRATKKERLRQRICHKFMYIPDRYGIFGCVGCGRCIRYCPAGLDVVEIMSRVDEAGALK